MDRIGANFEKCSQRHAHETGAYAFPIFIPLGQGPTEAEGKAVTGALKA